MKMDMKIKDDFIDSMNHMLGFDNFEDKMFNHFRNDFGLLLEEEKEKEDKVAKRNNNKKNKKINNGTYFSKIYCNSYNNVNSKEYEEKYQSQNINQINNGHNISECKEANINSAILSFVNKINKELKNQDMMNYNNMLELNQKKIYFLLFIDQLDDKFLKSESMIEYVVIILMIII